MGKIQTDGVSTVEYIWIDGSRFSSRLRSKTRLIFLPEHPSLEDFPAWTFDGDLTMQSSSEDCQLVPVRLYPNPLRQGSHYLLLCEVNDALGFTHPSNHRAGMRAMLDKADTSRQIWIGFEQPYSVYSAQEVLDVPVVDEFLTNDTYCAVGGGLVGSRRLADRHAQACLSAGLALSGWHTAAKKDSWVFQLGYRGADESCDVLTIADDLWVARYFLEILSEEMNCMVIYDVDGDQAPLATSFSTWQTRDKNSGIYEIQRIVSTLESLEIIDRTSAEFKQQFYRSDNYDYGVTSRQSAIRIPSHVIQAQGGYFVDRRPRSGSDPYRIAQYLVGSLFVGVMDSDRESQEDSQCGVHMGLDIDGR